MLLSVSLYTLLLLATHPVRVINEFFFCLTGCAVLGQNKTLLMPSRLTRFCILLPPPASFCPPLPHPAPYCWQTRAAIEKQLKRFPWPGCSLPIAWPQSRNSISIRFPFPIPIGVTNRPAPFPAVHLCDILCPLYPVHPPPAVDYFMSGAGLPRMALPDGIDIWLRPFGMPNAACKIVEIAC